MKKIGLLFGQETIFPHALIDRINQQKVRGLSAAAVVIDKVIQGEATAYTVILDRISHHVPFYRSWLKHAALHGTAVLNNPFWWSADEKLVNNELALRTGVAVPKTALLPSHTHPTHTTSDSFRNLAYPLDWDSIFAHTGFPAYLKPLADGGWHNVYRVRDREECLARHAETGQQVMLLQEEIPFEAYYRCYCIGNEVRIMPYDPRRLHHHRYEADFHPDAALQQTLREQALRLHHYLGYDFNSIEMAVHNGQPYAIDFFNPAPDADPHVIGEAHFEWVVDTSARYLIEKARAHRKGAGNLTWGGFLQQAAAPAPKPARIKANTGKAKAPKKAKS
ncbi:ATP-grasp domain-containing protein [Chitinophaga japonensis]|uniref:Glutathione synthase/RimK-type ligase-like ATP-grasp enzyme n=1 Tax=Chitinophaga japonensis TaxID=104662 RepID=A0A562T5M9_CHIJA|nr:hypothetical protein [Chitinophaga japonensis]TWI88851.1 glutathione synthase/RimK-type ligase-like ATP-grasp enzyme [Chitinophaga japonensis]